MYRRLTYFILALFLIFSSCEDKKSSNKKASKQDIEANKAIQKKRDSLLHIRDSVVKARKKIEEENSRIKKNPDFPIAQEELIPYLTEYGKNNPENKVKISTRFGDIEVTLFRDTPLHRANFIMLVKNAYFNDTFFHRVAPDFVIQGGNSDNSSTNSKRNKVGNYLIPNEFEAGHRHVRGAFSAAKYSEQNTSKASSPFEFFIVLNKNGAPHLNNEHTVFGKVTKGMDVVDKVASAETGQNEWPVNNIEIEVEIVK